MSPDRADRRGGLPGHRLEPLRWAPVGATGGRPYPDKPPAALFRRFRDASKSTPDPSGVSTAS